MASTSGSERISDIRALVVSGSAHSNWIFLELVTDSGLSGWGEATVDGGDAYVLEAYRRMRTAFIGEPVDLIRSRVRAPAAYPAPLPANAVLAALDQAEWDLRGRRLEAPVWELLGGVGRSLPYYANLNRGIGPDRSPSRFAECAAAATAGATAIKIAPFDGVTRTDWEDSQTRAFVRSGLERVEAVRDAAPEAALLIDCHWRFTERVAVRVLRELEAFEPYWVEAPVSETDHAAWRRVRERTDLRLAGGEMLRSPRDFRTFIEASGVDVVMPDVKYCGGITGLLEVAAVAASASVFVAPHNPSGPVASIASTHAATAMANFLILEWPWGESSIRDRLVCGTERFVVDRMELPLGAGLGVEVDRRLAADHPGTDTTQTVDDRLFGPDRPWSAW